jgi:hypothetical protein
MATTYATKSFAGQISNPQYSGESQSIMVAKANADSTEIGTIDANLREYAKAAIGGIRANPQHFTKGTPEAAALAIAIATAYQARVGNPADPSGDTYQNALQSVCANPDLVANSPSRIAEIAAVYGVSLLTS